MNITFPKNINWKLVGADIASALTMISMIPYDKDTMNIINQIVRPNFIPFVIKAGIASTLILRLWNRYSTKENAAQIQPQAGAVQTTITK